MPEMDYSLLNQKNIGKVRKYISGRYYGYDVRGGVGGVAISIGVLYTIPFWVTDYFTADSFACEVTVGAASANLKLGIYKSDSRDMPSELIYESGLIDASTASVKEVTINQEFAPGLYWFSLVVLTASVSVRGLTSNIYLPPVAATSFVGSAATQDISCYYQTGVTGAFPNPWTSTVVGAAAPKLMVRAK